MKKFLATAANDDFYARLLENGTLSVLRDGTVLNYSREIVRPILHESGYVRILYLKKYIKLHRLVYIAFNGHIPLGMFIDHEDEDKTNNHIDNLKLVTHAENMKNRKPSTPRMSNETAIEILTKRKSGMTVKAIAVDYPYHYNTISDLTRGRTFKHLAKYR